MKDILTSTMKKYGESPRDVRTWVEIDTVALAENFRGFRDILAPETRLMAVVKSNAYGHDIYQFAAEVARLGADWIAVDSIVEALAIRRAGIETPILVLGYTLQERYVDALDSGVSISVSSFETLRELSRFNAGGRRIRTHFKFDTGMHRQGFEEGDVGEILRFLKMENAPIEIEGVFTHFSGAKVQDGRTKTERQISVFERITDEFARAGYHCLRHAAATAGAIAFPDSHFDMVRVGIGLYGLWPSAEQKSMYEKNISLHPILQWKTIVSEVKRVSKGECVGYDGAEVLARDSVLAVCPVGYWHGYPRSLSGAGIVDIRGKWARVVGRVSMDMISVDVTDAADVSVGDEVTLVGGDESSADAVAALACTINYEIVTRINPLIRRIYFG